MKRSLFSILLLGVFLITGCATTGPAKDAASANVIYTNAPIKVALDASCCALKNLGYKIEKKDTDNFFVQGSCVNLLTGRTPFYARINVSQEASGTKITCSVDRPGAIKALDVIGYYSANNIYKEIAKILAQDEISYRKANKDKRESMGHESSR
ncbi:MAG: hypothetical protein WC738_01995 [Candidatus Omnitrophota bacterium]|jgi:hypothetical protein